MKQKMLLLIGVTIVTISAFATTNVYGYSFNCSEGYYTHLQVDQQGNTFIECKKIVVAEPTPEPTLLPDPTEHQIVTVGNHTLPDFGDMTPNLPEGNKDRMKKEFDRLLFGVGWYIEKWNEYGCGIQSVNGTHEYCPLYMFRLLESADRYQSMTKLFEMMGEKTQ